MAKRKASDETAGGGEEIPRTQVWLDGDLAHMADIMARMRTRRQSRPDFLSNLIRPVLERAWREMHGGVPYSVWRAEQERGAQASPKKKTPPRPKSEE